MRLLSRIPALSHSSSRYSATRTLLEEQSHSAIVFELARDAVETRPSTCWRRNAEVGTRNCTDGQTSSLRGSSVHLSKGVIVTFISHCIKVTSASLIIEETSNPELDKVRHSMVLVTCALVRLSKWEPTDPYWARASILIHSHFGTPLSDCITLNIVAELPRAFQSSSSGCPITTLKL
jgi:hypothetical protein